MVMLSEVYRVGGIGGVLGYQSRVVVDKLKGGLEKSIVLFLGLDKKGEPIEWKDDGTTVEQKSRFLDFLIEIQPRVEAIYQGVNGGGIPMPSCVLREIEKQERRYEARSKTAFGGIINSFQQYYNK